MFEKAAKEYQTEKRKRFNEYEQLCWGDVYKDFQEGAEFGYNSAIKWFDAKTSVPLPKQLGICRYTIEVISDKGDMVCYDYKDKCWKKIAVEDEKVTYVLVEIEMWCNKPTKEIE